MPGMAGPGGFGGPRKNKAAAAKGKKKPRSGNPAKAAQELQDAEARRAAARAAAPTGAAFGGQQDFDPSAMNLPKGFEKFLGK